MADSRLIAVCPSSALADGGDGVRFEVRRLGETVPAFVVRYRGRVRGFLNRCAHARMQLDWDDGRFFDSERVWLICSAHGALFDPADGACAGGPCAGRGGLTALAIEEVDGVVYWRAETPESA